MVDKLTFQKTRKEVRRAEAGLQARLEMERKPGGWAVLGSMEGADIEALAYVVMMQASKSAQEDLKAIMAGVKAVNAAKAKQRDYLGAKKDRMADAMDPDAFVLAVATLQVNALVAETKSDLDSLSEMGEMESLRLQMAMDRLSKMMMTLSNLMKKLADTQSSVVANLK